MQNSDFKRFTLAMAALEENFNFQCSREKVKLYFEMLNDLEIAQVEKAIYTVIRESIYPTFPTVGAIRQVVVATGKNKAVIAWDWVFRAVSIIGPGRSIRFNDPVIHSTIESMGGWEYFCSIPEKDWDWKRKEFLELYMVLAGDGREHPEYIIGHYESNNREKGYNWAIEAPVEWPPKNQIALEGKGPVEALITTGADENEDEQ